ncbi:MAG: VOC family protein [Pseudomonadota bacterium]
MAAVLDHLVIAAATLEQGLAWAERTFGLGPAGRGRHALMGTHNALWHLALPAAPDAYLEVIAIDPAAVAPERPRWFGLDDANVQSRLDEHPRLVAWQVRPGMALVDAIGAARTAGIDPGDALALTRDDLAWRLTVTADGRVPEGGRFPILIEWAEGTRRPPERLAPGGLALEALTLSAGTPALGRALQAIEAAQLVTSTADGPALTARLSTPAGPVTIAS